MTRSVHGLKQDLEIGTTRLVAGRKRAFGRWSHRLVALLIISCAFSGPAYAEELTIYRGSGSVASAVTGEFTLAPFGTTNPGRVWPQQYWDKLPEIGTLNAPGGPYHLYQNPDGIWLLCGKSCGQVHPKSLPLVDKLLQDQKNLSPDDKKQDEKKKPEKQENKHSDKKVESWCCINKHQGEKGQKCQQPHIKEDPYNQETGTGGEGYKTVACGEIIDKKCPASGNKDGDKPNVKPGEQPKPPAPPGGGNPAPPAPPPPPGGGGGGGGGNPLGGLSQMLPALMQALAQKGQQGQQGQQPGQQQGDLSDAQIMEMARAAQTAIAQATAMTQATAVAQATTVAQATAGIQQTSTASSTTSGETDSSASQTQVAVTPTSSPPANSTF